MFYLSFFPWEWNNSQAVAFDITLSLAVRSKEVDLGNKKKYPTLVWGPKCTSGMQSHAAWGLMLLLQSRRNLSLIWPALGSLFVFMIRRSQRMTGLLIHPPNEHALQYIFFSFLILSWKHSLDSMASKRARSLSLSLLASQIPPVVCLINARHSNPLHYTPNQKLIVEPKLRREESGGHASVIELIQV